MPSSSHAADIVHTEADAPSNASPRQDHVRGAKDLPPTDTVDLSVDPGPSSPEITSDAENAAKNQLLEIPRSRAIGSARMGGR
jgi:hypothetical protein